MVAADHRLLDEVVAELEAHQHGRLSMLAEYGPMPGGGWALCGTSQDMTRWTAAYVRSDRAVVPLVVGERDRVVQEFARIRGERIPVWDASQCPPPTVVVDRVAYHFTAAHGRRLVGVVQCKRGFVVLAALGDEIAVIEVVGRRTSVLHVGKPCSFREINVDAWRSCQRSGARRAEPDPPRRLSRAVLAEHRRIVHGIDVDVEGGPTVAEVLEASFNDLAERALALASSGEKEFKGQTKVVYLTGYLCKMAIAGFGKIARRIGGMFAFIKKHYPDFDITLGLFADVLTLLEATGTCVVPPRRPGQRIRLINLEGLSDPRSRQHRQFCRETRSRHSRVVGNAERVGAVPEARGPKEAATSATAAAPPEPVVVDTRHQDPSPPPAEGTTTAEISAVFRTAAASMLDAVAASSGPRTTATVDASMASPPAPPSPPAADAAPTEAASITASDAAVADEAEYGGGDSESPEPSVSDLGVDAAPQAGATNPGGQAAREYEEMLLDAIKDVDALGPAAGQTLLLSFCVGRGRISDAGDPRSDGDSPTPEDVTSRSGAASAGEVTRLKPRRSRRRLHLSSDHTLELPVVASILTRPGKDERPPCQEQEERGRGQVLGRSRSVGERSGVWSARGPPRAGEK